MLSAKNIFPKNINNIFTILVTPISSLRSKQKNYYSSYLTHIFSDLLSKSSVFKDCPEITSNNNTTSNFISFYYYLNIPYYPCNCLYKSLTPLTFDKFMFFVHTIFFGNYENLLKLTFNFLSSGDKMHIYKSEIFKILNHFYLNVNLNNEEYDKNLYNLEEIVNKCIPSNQLNYNQWKNISTEKNCDVFILLFFYICKSCINILNVENLNLLHKIETKSSQLNNKFASSNTVTLTANNLFTEFDNLNSKDETKLSVDVTEILFNFLCQTENINLEYIDPNDLNASYNSDMEVLDAFDKDKEEIFNKLYESTLDSNTEKKSSKKFANMTLAEGNALIEVTGFNDTIVGGGINLKMQTLGGDEIHNHLLDKLKMPGIKNIYGLQNKTINHNNFSDVSKFEGYVIRLNKLYKIKFYLVNRDLFIVDENSTLLSIINLTLNNINTKIINYKDNEKIKENKYIHLKLYGNNNFFFPDKDRNQAKDFIRLLYHKLNISISTHNDSNNLLSNLNGKYVADESKEITKFNKDNFIKIFKVNEQNDINSVLKNKKDLYLKMIYKKNNNPLKENYVFEVFKKLASIMKENFEIGVRMYDKYENSIALYLIYLVSFSSTYNKGLSFLSIKGQVTYIKTVATLIHYLHKLGLCLNCTSLDINIKSPIDFFKNYFLSDNHIIFYNESEKIEHKKMFGYCPPEVLNGEPSNNNIDLWFFGNLMYFTLFKKLPFYDEGNSFGDSHIYSCIFNREITFDNASTKINSSTTNEDYLNDLYDLIVKCLNVDYNKRGSSSEALMIINKVYSKYKK